MVIVSWVERATVPIHAFPLAIRVTRVTLPHPRGGRYYGSIRLRESLVSSFRLRSRLARRTSRDSLSGVRLATLASLWKPSVLRIGRSMIRLNQSPLSSWAGRGRRKRLGCQRERVAPPHVDGFSGECSDPPPQIVVIGPRLSDSGYRTFGYRTHGGYRGAGRGDLGGIVIY